MESKIEKWKRDWMNVWKNGCMTGAVEGRMNDLMNAFIWNVADDTKSLYVTSLFFRFLICHTYK